MDTSFSAPPPGATTRPAGPPPPQPANRKELDSRRVLARLIDALVVGAPAIVVALGIGRGLSIFLVSLMLAYFFLCEALWGQTIGKRVMGLRVLMRDGRPATASAVSARTVLRLIEDGPIGLVIIVLSGRRRQRLGDLLGGTIVARATSGLPHAPLSPMLLVYPVAWSIGAIALALVPVPDAEYLTAVDAVCEQRQAAIKAAPAAQRNAQMLVQWDREDHGTLEALPTPAGAEGLRREILALDAEMRDALSDAVQRAGTQPDPNTAFEHELAALSQGHERVSARYAELGLPACAGQST